MDRAQASARGTPRDRPLRWWLVVVLGFSACGEAQDLVVARADARGADLRVPVDLAPAPMPCAPAPIARASFAETSRASGAGDQPSPASPRLNAALRRATIARIVRS